MGDATWTQRYKAIQYDAVRTVPEKVRNLQTNRIASIGNQTPTYDAAGEMTSDGTGTGSTQYTWNAEGRIATVTPYGGATTPYVYDGEGHLVAEGTTSPTLFWYGADGKLLGMTGAPGNVEWISFDGRRIAKFVMAPAGPWGAQFYDNADGSLLLETDMYGNTNCRANYDPFGDPVGSGCQAYENIQYAGLYTDSSGGVNDLATHRQLSDTYYRWLSPDPSGVKVVNLSDPQTWNMYAYALDNPTSLNDPSGLQSKCGDVDYKACLNPNTNGRPSSAEKNSLHGSAKAVGSAHGQRSPEKGIAILPIVSGAVDIGVGIAGATAQGSAAASVPLPFFNRDLHPSFGAEASGSAVAYAGQHIAGKPTQHKDSFVVGLFAGVGGGVDFTNAGNAPSMKTMTNTLNIDFGLGPAASISVSSGNDGITSFSITFGWGIGMGVTETDTATGTLPSQ